MHLTEYEIAKYLDGKANPEEVERIQRHISSCVDCLSLVASSYRLVKSLEKAPKLKPDKKIYAKVKEFVKSPAKPVSFSSIRFSLPVQFALILIAVLATVFVIYKLNFMGVSGFRGGEVNPKALLVEPADNAVVSGKVVTFRWRKLPDVIWYNFKVYRVDGTIVANLLLKKNFVNVSPDTIFTDGTRYLWKVEAVFKNGAHSSSRLRFFVYKKSR